MLHFQVYVALSLNAKWHLYIYFDNDFKELTL